LTCLAHPDDSADEGNGKGKEKCRHERQGRHDPRTNRPLGLSESGHERLSSLRVEKYETREDEPEEKSRRHCEVVLPVVSHGVGRDPNYVAAGGAREGGILNDPKPRAHVTAALGTSVEDPPGNDFLRGGTTPSNRRRQEPARLHFGSGRKLG